MIEANDETVPWAADGSNVTLFLVSVDPVNLAVGSVLCPLTNLVTVVSGFTARVIMFDITVPITAGSSVSRNNLFAGFEAHVVAG